MGVIQSAVLLLLFLSAVLPASLSAAGTVIFNESGDNFPLNWSITVSSFARDTSSFQTTPYSIVTVRKDSNPYPSMTRDISVSAFDAARLSFYERKTSGATITKISCYTSSWNDVYANNGPGSYNWYYRGPVIIPVASAKIRVYCDMLNGIDNTWFDDILLEADKKPVLNWTGESGYEADGLNPEGGMASQVFTWRVNYADGDNDAPAAGYPKVRIMKSGAEISGSPFAMSETDPADMVFSDGKFYSYSRTLAAGADYTYYLEATDGWLSANNTSTLSGPVVIQPDIKGYVRGPSGSTLQGVKVELTGTENRITHTNALGYYEFAGVTFGGNYAVTPSSYAYYSFNPAVRVYTNLQTHQSDQDFSRDNSAPALSYTGEAGYESSGVNFILGSTNTVFIYRVKYSDPENDPPKPGYPELHIKKGGAEMPGSPFIMTENDLSDNCFSDGKIYFSSTTLFIGLDYSYYFAAIDTFGAQGVSGEITAPDVTNSPLPILEWCHDRYFVSVYEEQTPCFRLVYYDYYDSMPSAGYPKLTYWLKGSASQLTETLDLKGAQGTGWLYEKTLELPVGIYLYRYSVMNAQFSEEYSLELSSFAVTRRPENPENRGIPGNSTVSSGKVVLNWSGTDQDGGRLTYRLYMGTDASSMKLIYEGEADSCEINELDCGREYFWQVEAVDEFGVGCKSQVYSFKTLAKVEKAFNYPNPFSPGKNSTSIVFDMPETGSAEINILSEFGDLCWRGAFYGLPKGSNEVAYDGKDNAGEALYNGTYCCIIVKKYGGRESRDSCRILVIK
ncbi:MAG: hypothetical protein ABII64_07075 [Elusimicrobiota bacterium]